MEYGKKIEVGKIVNTHGLKGEVKIDFWTDSSEVFLSIKKLYLEENGKSFNVQSARLHKNMILAMLSGITTLDEAETFKGKVIWAEISDLPKLPEGVHYIRDLLGLSVVTDSGEKLGVLSDIFNTGSNDIYVVKGEDGKEILLPKIPDVVKEINPEEGRITVTLLEGLI